MTTKYKVGDRVRVVGTSDPYHYHGHGKEGLITRIRDGKYGDYSVKVNVLEQALSENDIEPIEPVPAEPATISFTLDIPNDLMKEFADHCERAADALARIQEMMSK